MPVLMTFMPVLMTFMFLDRIFPLWGRLFPYSHAGGSLYQCQKCQFSSHKIITSKYKHFKSAAAQLNSCVINILELRVVDQKHEYH